MNLTSMLESTARKFPAKPALVSDLGPALSYREFLDASKRAAAVFRDAGVQPGERVGVMTFNTVAFPIAMFGLLRAGAAIVPINHKLTATEVRYIVAHAGVSLVVADDTLAATCTEAGAARVLTTTDGLQGSFDALVEAAEPWDGVAVSDDDIAEVLYTSGTTSAPKGCLHRHGGLALVAAHTTAAVGLSRADRLLIAMPIWHASPLNNWFLSMIYLGGTVILAKEYHPLRFLESIRAYGVSAFFGAPIAYLAPLQLAAAQGLDLSQYGLDTVRLWLYGGAPLGAETVQRIEEAYRSKNFYQVYGMTEMGPVGTALYPEEQVTKAGSIGAGGMPGVDIRVVTSDGQEAGAGEVGEIWMRADTRMLGYLGNDEATNLAFEGEWYRTGDLARVDEDGYLFIVDRAKDVVITGGENVFSPEVEEAVRLHPAVADVAVIGRPHAEWGETVTAVVVLAPEAELTLGELREHLEPRLARYKIPRGLELVAALPRNPSGKVMKHVLRAS